MAVSESSTSVPPRLPNPESHAPPNRLGAHEEWETRFGMDPHRRSHSPGMTTSRAIARTGALVMGILLPACFTPTTMDVPVGPTGEASTDDGESSGEASGAEMLETGDATTGIDDSSEGANGESSDGGESIGTTGSDAGTMDAWAHHREITLSSATSQGDHQVLLSLPWSDDMQLGAADLRILDAAYEELPLWIESTDDTVRVWVRVPEIPAGAPSSLHAYYGNPDAAAVSDPHATFLLFDDFEDLDPNVWLGGASVSDGRAWLTDTVLTSTWDTGEPIVVEATLEWTGSVGLSPSTGLTLRNGGVPFAWLGEPVHAFAGTPTGELAGELTGVFGIGLGHGAARFFFDHTAQGSTSFDAVGATEIGIGFGPFELVAPDAYFEPDPLAVDRILVRRLADADIVVDIGPED